MLKQLHKSTSLKTEIFPSHPSGRVNKKLDVKKEVRERRSLEARECFENQPKTNRKVEAHEQ
jgi:hypothetical protein